MRNVKQPSLTPSVLPSLRLALLIAPFVEHVIEPFDPAKLKFEPHQVKSAWVDPEFLKQLKKKS